MDIVSFLHGMYYAGKLPSRAESKEIAQYLGKNGLVSSKSKMEKQVIEAVVTDAIAEVQRVLSPEEKNIEEDAWQNCQAEDIDPRKAEF